MCLKSAFILISNDKHTNKFSKFCKKFKCYFNKRNDSQIKSVEKFINGALKNEKN